MQNKKISSPSAKEIGSLKRIEKYLLHLEGKPIEQAKMIQDLLNKGYTQQKISKVTGWPQSMISLKLKLLNLIPELQEKAESGDIIPSTAWALSCLPPKRQRKYAKKQRITLEEVERERRSLAITGEVRSLLDKEIPGESREEKKIKCPRCGHEF